MAKVHPRFFFAKSATLNLVSSIVVLNTLRAGLRYIRTSISA